MKLLTLQGQTDLRNLAKEWVRGREIELLTSRIKTAIENFENSDSYDPDLREDLEAYAEELKSYSSTLESIPTSILAELIEEILSDM